MILLEIIDFTRRRNQKSLRQYACLLELNQYLTWMKYHKACKRKRKFSDTDFIAI